MHQDYDSFVVIANMSQLLYDLRMSIAVISEKLRQAGYSTTRQREAVFSALRNNGAMTMGELTNACASKMDRASVYRAVQLFEQLGFVRRVNQGWKFKLELSDIFSEHHHHIMCTKCGKIADLRDDSRLATILDSMVKSSGFTISGHELEIRGLCINCQK